MEDATTRRCGSRKWTTRLTIALLLIALTSSHAAAEVFSFAFGHEGSGAGEFQWPIGVAVDDDGNVYVVDADNERVQKFDQSGGFLRMWSNFLGDDPPVLTGIAVEGSIVYVTDYANLAIRRFDLSGTPLSSIDPECDLGVGCVDPDGPGGLPFLFRPEGVAVDALHNVYAIGLYHLSKFDAAGHLVTEFPLGGIVPKAIAVDGAGDIIIYEKDNGSINKYDATGTLLFTLYSPCVLPSGPHCVDPDGPGGPLELGDGQFGIPAGIAVDAANNIYVADPSNARVQKFDPDGNFLGKFGGPGTGDGQFGPEGPRGLAIDAAGRVYVSDPANNRIQVWIQEAVPAGADLVESAVSTPPAAVIPGSQFAVTDTVRNRGTAAAGATTTRYYMSETTHKTAQSALLKGTRAVPALAAGATSRGTRTVAVPVTMALGTYYLLACADDTLQAAETDESNNCTAAAAPIIVGRPDLVVTALDNPPASVPRGGRFAVTETVANQGPLGADPSATRYFFSVDGQWSPEDRRLTGTRSVPALAAGASFPATPTAVTVTVPTNVTPGTYYLLACADDMKRVLESNETNNCRASATPAVVR